MIDQLKERDCAENIRKYKEQLRFLRVQSGLSQTSISHSQLDKQRRDMADRLNVTSYLALKHRLLNTYVHSYQQKLCLNNDKNVDPEEIAGHSLTVDFNEMLYLRNQSQEMGYDPYTQFIKQRNASRKENREKIKPVVECFRD